MSIEHLQKARADIAAILRDQAPADVPAGFESVASRLSEADSSVIHIYTQLYDERALADVQKMVEADTDDVAVDIDRLPADADEETRQRLVERLASTLARNLIDYPWLSDPASRLSKSGYVTAQTFVDAVRELYNPAQLDVLARANTLANDQVRAMREESRKAAGERTPHGA
ncbi:hypothetical protein [Actinopolymorpha alba]|uniref:hypothetical protein n=1 Tax=Actinopolymorpha alba TaxID=533267 RepID=UPI00192BB12F|nr:hypothetical protein [Actinopolymorpha alba]